MRRGAVNTDFWLAVSTIGPVTFLAIGVLGVDLVRSGRIPAENSRILAFWVALVALAAHFYDVEATAADR